MNDADPVGDAARAAALGRLRDRYAADELSLDGFARGVDGVLSARFLEELRDASPEQVTLTATSPTPSEAQSLVRQLAPGEEILWIGRPGPGIEVTPSDRALAPLAVAFVAFAALWETAAVSGHAPALFVAWGALFAVLGLYVGLRGVIVRSMRSRRSLYAITTRRVARIIRDRRGDEVESTLLSALPTVSAVSLKSGRGTLVFRRVGPTESYRDVVARALNPTAHDEPFRFSNVQDVEAVARLISNLQAHSQGGEGGRTYLTKREEPQVRDFEEGR